MQGVLRVEGIEPLDHRHQRSHADASSDQEVPAGGLDEFEVVAGCRHVEFVTRTNAVVHGSRATPAPRELQNADDVSRVFARIVAERVLADESAREKHVDVRSGRESGEGFTARVDQLERVDVNCFVDDRPDLEREHH